MLLLDPWGLGPALHLPPQPALAAESVQVRWRVSPSDQPGIPAKIRQDETGRKTTPFPQDCRIPLTRPAPEYRVSLVLVRTGEDGAPSEETVREWRIPGIAEEHPLLWFDPKDGRLIPSPETLSGARLWVLRRPDVVLEADPPDSLYVSEQFPRLPWAWGDFIGEEVDLSRVRGPTARWGDRPLDYFMSELQDQPSLEGGNRLPVEDGYPPLYVGAPPALRIPLSPYDDSRLHRWYVEVESEGPALPEHCISGTLADLEPEIREEGAVLDLRAWLGDTPMRTYKVKVRELTGRRADLGFRILPVLEIVGHDTLYLPEEAGESPPEP
ncbi:MAG: hypothetical protein D6793_06485 [Thermoflexia bacterium]|nr:MAG: hypothetical protein D6793_06485 [Thermoflexia bacterium]